MHVIHTKVKYDHIFFLFISFKIKIFRQPINLAWRWIIYRIMNCKWNRIGNPFFCYKKNYQNNIFFFFFGGKTRQIIIKINIFTTFLCNDALNETPIIEVSVYNDITRCTYFSLSFLIFILFRSFT